MMHELPASGSIDQDRSGESPMAKSLRNLEIPPLPMSAEFAHGTEKLARIGEIAVVRAAWGHPVTNEEIFSVLASNGLLTPEIRRDIEGIGFPVGHYFPFDTDLYSEALQERQAHYAAKLTQRVMQARGWVAADVLVVATSTCDASVPARAAEILSRDGKGVGLTQFYGQACNGATAAINDLLRDESLQGAQAVVVGMDSLSGITTDLENPITFRTFGNGGGAFAGIIGEEIEFVTGRTVVEYDSEGVILASPAYRFPPAGDHICPHPWYELRGNETRRNFARTSYGVFLDIPRSPDGKLRMDGLATMNLFINNMTPITLDVLGVYDREFSEEYGPLGKPLSHQPSLGVNIPMNRRFTRTALEGRGIVRGIANRLSKMSVDRRAGKLQELGITDFNIPQVDFVMRETGINNISAGTSLVAAVEMAERGELRPGQANLVLGFGIGAVYQANVWNFR